jgi:serine/threonine protein kinase
VAWQYYDVPQQSLTPSDPTRVGRWALQARLGAGAMGVVYVGVDGIETCALKVIRPDLATDPTFRARFRREITAAQCVSNTYVAQVVEGDPDAELPWMASELINGPSLEEFVHEHGTLEPERLVALAGGAC